MDILDKLFGSRYRTKILRLFIFNPEGVFDKKEIAKRSKTPTAQVGKELTLLKNISLIKEKLITVSSGRGKKKVKTWQFNSAFPLTQGLRSLLNIDFLRRRAELAKRFKNCGKIKLLVVSGVFIDDEDRRLDLLIVGEKLKRNVIDNIVKVIEADVGRELTYATLETEEFLYRMGTSDKFIRDVFDYPHEKVVDKLVF